MGPKQERRLRLPVEEERVLGVARRMFRRKVQRLEVVEVALDLGAVRDRVTHPKEDLLDPAAHEGDRVEGARPRPPSRQRDVHRGGPLTALRLGPGEGLAQAGDSFLDLAFGGVRARPVARALFGRELADA